MKEIITLQLGRQSNHLASHFWNTQESYFTYEPGRESSVDHDVHWRPGIGADGSDTFTPRTVIYDLKGGFGSLRKINALYEPDPDADPASSALWSGPRIVETLPQIPVADYQQSLDQGPSPQPLTTSAVRYWSDYGRVFYHPRSLIQLNEYDIHSSLNPFDKWAAGELLFQTLDREHDLVDRDFRPFAEEADQMQGIQVFASLHDAWSSFASRYMESLRDDYPKSSIWVWGLQPQLGPLTKVARLQNLVNMARGLVDMSHQASLLLPLGLNQAIVPTSLGIDMSSDWHTSALISAAVETATLPSRLKPEAGNCDTLDGMAETLIGGRRRTVANVMIQVGEGEPARNSPVSYPRLDQGDSKNEPRRPSDLRLDLSFAVEPRSRRGYVPPTKSHVFAHLSTSRGFNNKSFKSSLEPEEMDGVILSSYCTSLPFPLLDSFPSILSGYTFRSSSPAIAINAALQTDSSIVTKLNALKNVVTRYLPVEERENVANEMSELADEYKGGWSSGSDEFDD